MKLLATTLAAASITLFACGGSDSAPAPAEAAPAEAPPAEAAPDAAAEGEAAEAAGHHEGHDAEGHHAEGAEGHHGAEGEELTGFDKLRAAGNPRDVDGWTLFGADFTLTESQPVDAAVAAADASAEKVVRVEGTVADVCSKMGCWMVVQHGDANVRVTMKEHGFGVDRDCAGSVASLEGTLREKAVDAETAKHYESESRNPDAMPEKGAEKVWEIVATSVAIKPAA